MATNDNKQLIFPMGISFDPAKVDKKVREQLEAIQKIVDKNPVNILGKQKTEAQRNAQIVATGKVINAATLNETKVNNELTNSYNKSVLAANKLANQKKIGLTATTKAATTAANTERIEQERLAKAMTQTSIAKQRLINMTDSQTSSYAKQGMILGGLKTALGSYISLFAGFRLVANIKEVTAEFEMQRVALAAIINDKVKADALFAQVVELGLQSPFQIRELITYTKQLAAYRIETENLSCMRQVAWCR